MDVNTPGAQGTGNESEEFLAFVKQAVAEEAAKQFQNQPGSTLQNTLPTQPIQVNLNGQTFSFANQEELNRALNNTFSAYNQQISTLQNAQLTSRGAEVTGQEPEAPKFDMDTFVKKMQVNPPDAFDYVDQIRYGYDNPVEAVKEAIESRSQLEDLSRVLAVYQFKDAHPEYEGNPQVANTMYSIMEQAGLPFNVQGLEAAYSVGLLQGHIPLPAAFQQQGPPGVAQNGQQGPPGQQQLFNPSPYAQYTGPGTDPRQFNGGYDQNRGFMPPPQTPRFAAESAPDLASMAQDMSPEQIEAVFARFQR